MGTNTMVAAVGLVIGPVLGGALVDISWHWVFWFNVPFALLGSAWAYSILREITGRGEDTTFDALGTVTFLIGLTGLVLGISKGGIEGWHGPVVFGGLAAAAIFLPLFVVVERRVRAPMLDLTIFNNRLFSAASAAAFLNGLARFALMFLFVFYFQGVQGDTPILAGLKLAPLAIGMLVASPLAGIYADRNGSRALASIGMLVTAAGLALMTTLHQDTSYWWPGLFQFVVGRRLGHVQLAQHGGDDGRRRAAPPRHRLRRARARAEHRRRAVDRLRDGRRHHRHQADRPVQHLLRPGYAHQRRAPGAVPVEHAPGAVVPRRRLDRRRGRVVRPAEARERLCR